MSENSVSVVMASYNEKDNITEAITRISKALQNKLKEIIIVDDNSPDGTWNVVHELNHPKVKLIRRINERGLASALKTGVDASSGDIVVWLDCDLGIPPEDIPRLVTQLQTSDVCIGSRYKPGGSDSRPFIRTSLSYLLNLYAAILLGFKVRDYTSGFIAVKRHVINKIPLNPKGFGEYFVEFCYKCQKQKFIISEIGYRYGPRKSGISKSDGSTFTLLKYGWQYGTKMIKLRVLGRM